MISVKGLSLIPALLLMSTIGQAQAIVTGGNSVAIGSAVVSNGVNQPTVYQTKPVIDVRDYGVTGNGTTDDTTAMQAAASAACNTNPSVGTALTLPNGARIKVSSTITFSKCWGVTLDGQNSQGQTTYGANSNAAFVWAGSAGGTVVEVNQTRDSSFGNFAIEAGTANIGLLIDEAGTVTTITTNNSFPNLAVSNGSANSNWIAVDICPTAPGNCEAQNFSRLLLTCGGSTPTSTSNGIGLKYEAASGAEPYYETIKGAEINGCSKGIDIEGGFNIDIDGGLMGGNYTDLLVNAGALIRYANFRSESAIAQIVIGNASFSSLKDLTIENIAFAGLTNSTTTISYPYVSTGGRIRLIKNAWDANSTVTPFGNTGSGVFTGSLDSQDNVYPNGTICPSAAFAASGATYISLNDLPFGTCNPEGLVVMGSGGAAGISTNLSIISTLATGTAPFSVASVTPVATLVVANHPRVYEAGVLTTAEKIYTNTQALTTGTATHTFAASFTFTSSSTFGCTCTDRTAANACQAVPASATTVTLAGTSSDVLWLSCSGH